MKQIRTVILFGILAVFLYLINSGIVSSEQNIANGQVAYLELAPVDPRSLIQGDYMQLAYQVERDMRDAESNVEGRGQIVMVLDEDNVAHFDRFYDEGMSLSEGEIRVNYRARSQWNIQVGVDSFFFQEGQAEAFEDARFAEVRILQGGGVMLVNLTDEDLTVINPE